jgi:hypothetical protein
MSSSQLFPLPAKSPLVGIARLASQGESLREGHNVEYFTLPARSILNRCVSNRNLPFTWTINPYRGCEFACKYCYARYTHEFMEMRDGAAFEQKIYVKQHAVELLRHDLRKVKPNEAIALGTATDPYQPAERRYQITRGILEEFARHRGFELGIVTKSNLIVRDLDVLRAVAQHNALSVHMTVTTMNTDLARILEPRAPRPDLRIEAVRELSVAGINVGVSASPVLPGITDALFRGDFPSLPRTEFFTSRGKLSPALSRPFLPSRFLRQAHCATGHALSAEIRHPAPRAARFHVRGEMAGASDRRADDTLQQLAVSS